MIAYRYFFVATIIKPSARLLMATILCITQPLAYAESSWFSRYKHEAEELLELKPKKKSSSLRIDHELPGSVTVQGWQQEHVAVTIRKKTASDDDLGRVSSTLTQTEHGLITLQITESEELKKNVQVDITVHVPHAMPVTINTQNDVSVAHLDNTVRVETLQGDITAHTTRGALHLETEKGDIESTHARGPITAYTDRGAITITDSSNSITAQTARGPITIACAQIPSTAHLDIRAQKRGTITLILPEATDAHLVADTTRGIITSDVPVILERHTAVLNSGTYQDMQRHIRGTLGTQATAEIRLSATKDIHLTTTTTT